MSFDPTEYIVRKLREYDPNIDSSPGTAIRDLLVNPMRSMLEPFYTTHQYVEQTLGLTSLSGISEEAMDNIASNYLVDRNIGAKALGYVRIYFRDARTITIPANTEFVTTAGLKFYSKNAHTITTTEMLANAERYPYYHTGDILVEAASQGIEYQIGPEEIKYVSNLGTPYNLVTNINAFTGAAERNTNQELYDKIVDYSYNTALNSLKGIEKLLLNTFGSLEDVYVVGAGSDLMLRDLIADTTAVDYVNYYETTYNGKVFGRNSSPYPQSRAYYGAFVDVDLTNSGYMISELPVPANFSREFGQDDYANIFKEDGLITSITTNQFFVSENFDASGYASAWVLSDEYMGHGVTTYSGEITAINNVLYMGNDPNRAPAYMLIPAGVLALISGYITNIQQQLDIS